MKSNIMRSGLAALAPTDANVTTSIVEAVTVSDKDSIPDAIESVDPTTRHVQLRGPAGGLLTVTAGPQVRNFGVSFIGRAKIERTADVTAPQMQDFLKTLKVGDQVDLTYTKAIAVSVEDASG